MRRYRTVLIACVVAAAPAAPGAINCSLLHYKPSPGLTAAVGGDVLAIAWDGEKGHELRLAFAIARGAPVIQEVAIRRGGAAWVTVARDLKPEFRVVSGFRRITNQQLDPLAGLGVRITQEIIDRYKWDAFWDAPLNIPGGEAAHANNTPPQRGVLNQPGLPRKPDEVKRAAAAYRTESCEVKTDGARIEVSFPAVRLGVFDGKLQYTVYKGANLIRQEVIAKTEEPSVAYKYDVGLQGLTIARASRVRWRSPLNRWEENRLAGGAHEQAVIVKAGNRLIVAEMGKGSIAIFPPPHNFFWARESASNLGYNWYRKDDASSFSIGVRQAESEELASWRQNCALRSARPGTWQRMPVYFYITGDSGAAAIDAALAFTRGDRFKTLPGFHVMATHFHMGLVGRAARAGGPGGEIPDLEVLKAAGVGIVAPIDGGNSFGYLAGPDEWRWTQWSRGAGARQNRGSGAGLKYLADYYEVARRQSGRSFTVMANAEVLRGPVARALGGHTDLLLSHPVYWLEGRGANQPLSEPHDAYGRIYHLGSAADVMEMARREDILIYMPHPRSKGSTGFPDAIRKEPFFLDPAYRGIGFRWGMGLDGSERRLSEYRCLPLWDEMNNWVADLPAAPKFIEATSELYRQDYGDDVYANNPVNYVKVDRLPRPGDWSPIVKAMKSGDYFVTSGEVLIPLFSLRGAAIVADVEWTFPLDFVEVVWGNGQRTDRQIISTTDLPPFGKRRFEIPFTPAGKKWVRFAAWDSAGNGALAQPVKVDLKAGR